MTQVNLIQMMPDERRVLAWAASRGFLRGEDLGYALHAMLSAAFGDAAPKVFSWLDVHNGYRAPHLLAYSDRSADALREHAGFFGEPQALEALGVAEAASKVVPAFKAGQRLGFEVVSRPVVRSNTMEGEKRKTFEHDAYLHARRKAAEEGSDPGLIDRDKVYADWIEGRLAEQGVDVQSIRVVARRQHGVARRARPKDANTSRLIHVQGQEVRFDGVMEVVDPEAFAAALSRGVGRHRSFGYGMLVLRPAGAQAIAA